MTPARSAATVDASGAADRPQSPRIYLAGPDVFAPHAAELLRRKQDLCRDHGLVGLSPFEPEAGPPQASQRIFAANVALMRQADAVIANLTPFRGISADVGTAFELGFMTALGKRLYAYSNDGRPFRERVAAVLAPFDEVGGDRLFASDGLAVEDFGLSDNLMLDEALLAGSRALITSDAVASGGAFDDLTAFEACVLQAARDLLDPQPNGPATADRPPFVRR